jgi:hypothetical protein
MSNVKVLFTTLVLTVGAVSLLSGCGQQAPPPPIQAGPTVNPPTNSMPVNPTAQPVPVNPAAQPVAVPVNPTTQPVAPMPPGQR